MAQPQIFEGTATEIIEAFNDFLDELDQQEFTPGQPLTDPHEREVSRLIAEKFAKHGHSQ